MNKQDIKSFFDALAPEWDAQQPDRSSIIERILDNAHITEGQDILDVACGTGVLFPYYRKRAVASVTGIDLSSEMVELAKRKFSALPDIRIICADIEALSPAQTVDHVMIYNALPHFPDPQRLFAHLAAFVKSGGRLTIAHGMSRTQINQRHKEKASQVSLGLPDAQELQGMLQPYFAVDVCISDDSMYEVSGVKRA